MNAKSASTPIKINWEEEIGDLNWRDENSLRVSNPSYEMLVNADNGCVLSKIKFGDNLNEETIEKETASPRPPTPPCVPFGTWWFQ